jgi:hypothetical protein
MSEIRSRQQESQSGGVDAAACAISFALVAVAVCVGYVLFAELRWRVSEVERIVEERAQTIEKAEALVEFVNLRHQDIMKHELRLRRIEKLLSELSDLGRRRRVQSSGQTSEAKAKAHEQGRRGQDSVQTRTQAEGHMGRGEKPATEVPGRRLQEN